MTNEELQPNQEDRTMITPPKNWFSRNRDLLLPLLVILFVVSAGLVWFFQKPQSKPIEQANQNQEPAVDDSWKNYENTEFGFQLKFTDAWKGLKVDREEQSQGVGGARILKFGVPTSSPSYNSGSGIAYPFSLYIYDPATWNQLTQTARNAVNYITKNSDYVFTYVEWKESPVDLESNNFEIRKVVDSFTLTNPESSSTKWKVYTNSTYGFEFQYPTYANAGELASNSTLGSVTEPVKGIFAGTFVLVPLDSADVKQSANDLVNNMINAAKNPPAPDEEGPAIECQEEKYSNISAQIKAVSCTGEGGAAFYAVIDGQKTDIFVDGYSRGFTTDLQLISIKSEDLRAFFASFKFQ